jgi:hypothetical protein
VSLDPLYMNNVFNLGGSQLLMKRHSYFYHITSSRFRIHITLVSVVSNLIVASKLVGFSLNSRLSARPHYRFDSQREF